jgi:hypothetical protein
MSEWGVRLAFLIRCVRYASTTFVWSRDIKALGLDISTDEEVKEVRSWFSTLSDVHAEARLLTCQHIILCLTLPLPRLPYYEQYQTKAPAFVHTYYKLTGSNKLEPKDPKVLITAKVMFSVRLTHTKKRLGSSCSAAFAFLVWAPV